jgi:glycosyltransferase involved in cell wall biosynthesis
MPRLAWFTPLPPTKSGIAQYNRELLPHLSSFHQIDLFVAGPPARFVSPHPRIRVFDAHDFIWKHRREPYDLTVYQLGNAPCHDYMWAYAVRYPGLIVLHDGQLHHARARALLQQKRYDDYRSEFWFNHPDANADLAELGAEGLLGSLTYFWPMLRTLVESSRLVVVHNQWLADQISDAHPGSRVHVISMGVPPSNASAGARAAVRARHKVSDEAVLVVAFGKVTPEKRIAEAIRALAAISDAVPNAHLLLAGETVEYFDPMAEARAVGVERKVSVAGFVADADIDEYLAAADVCLCMRWPSSRETSASWLRCIAAGKPTITTDLIHTVDIPMLDPRSWNVSHAQSPEGRTADPVGVSIDILDEDHSLKLAMRRLATDPRLRQMLGENALRLWGERFRLDQMTSSYLASIAAALAAPMPEPSSRAFLPPHLLDDGTGHAERVLRDAGLSDALRSDMWTGRTE